MCGRRMQCAPWADARWNVRGRVLRRPVALRCLASPNCSRQFSARTVPQPSLFRARVQLLFGAQHFFRERVSLFRLLARDFFEHDFHPFTAFGTHSPDSSLGSTMASIALVVSGWYPGFAFLNTRLATSVPEAVFISPWYKGSMSLRRPMVFK